jgi:hypothetical protein
MNTRTVSLKTYPCGTMVLEVITTAVPIVAPASIKPVALEPVPA